MRGAELRVRPVVMTSLTAALGLFPAAIATSIGSQAQKPLAIVVVGGMLVTLFLTRYLMPVLYSFFPRPAGHAHCRFGPDPGLALHRPLPPAVRGHPARPRRGRTPPRPCSGHGHDGPRPSPGHRRFRRPPAMKINWKLILAVVLIAAGATGVTLNKKARAQVIKVWKQIAASVHGEPSAPATSPGPRPRSRRNPGTTPSP